MPCTVKVYALSTCVHCKNVIKFLDDKQVRYEHVFVDHLQGDERKNMLAEIREINPNCSFPTIRIGGKTIVGFRREDIEEALRG